MVSLIPKNVEICDTSTCVKIEREENTYSLELKSKGKARTVQAKIIIGADGANSIVRNTFYKNKKIHKYTAIQEWYKAEKISPFYSCIFDKTLTDSYCWTISKDKYFIIGGAFPTAGSGKKFEMLKEKIKDRGISFAKPIKKEACFVYLNKGLTSTCTGKNGVYLAGESAGMISPSSLEGISYAMESAKLLAEILNAGLVRESAGFPDKFNIGRKYYIKTMGIRMKLTAKLFKMPFMYNRILRAIVMKSGLRAIEKKENEPMMIEMKYPIVLVHGIIAHDRGGLVNFWGRIPERLKEHGIKVYFGNTDAWGSYESNAEILRTTIEKVLQETKSDKVNILAHSKGGIDSRYLVWKYNFGDKVASLTTISTPHHGAEIADLIYKQKIVHTDNAKKILATFGKIYGDINPDLYNVNYQLTTEKMKEFNENITADKRVYYQCLYSAMKDSMDDLVFFYSHQYIKKITGENDGLVTEQSAQWGTNITKIEGSISHGQIVDLGKKEIAGIDIPEIYVNIARGLSEKGF